MRYLVFVPLGVIIGVVVMFLNAFILELNEAEQVKIDCKPTNMYAISAGRKMRVYDCSDGQ